MPNCECSGDKKVVKKCEPKIKTNFKCVDLIQGIALECINDLPNTIAQDQIFLVTSNSTLYVWNGVALETPIPGKPTYPIYFYDTDTKFIWCSVKQCEPAVQLKTKCNYQEADKVLDCKKLVLYELNNECQWLPCCEFETDVASKLFKTCKDTVVSISSRDKDNNWFTATGFIMCKNSKVYIVTAGHVVIDTNNYDDGNMRYCEKEEYWGTISNVNGSGVNGVYELEFVGVDGAGDVGLLKIKDPEPSANPNLPDLPIVTSAHKCLEWGDSRAAVPGTFICVIGDPFGIDAQSISCGVVRDNKYAERTTPVIETVFHDVSTYGGNSGSPVLDKDGKVIGVHSYGINGFDELKGATSQYIAEKVVCALIEWDCDGQPDDQINHPHVDVNGRYIKGYMGVVTRPVRARDVAERGVGNASACGVLVNSIPFMDIIRDPWPFGDGSLNFTNSNWNAFAMTSPTDGYVTGKNDSTLSFANLILAAEHGGNEIVAIDFVYLTAPSFRASTEPGATGTTLDVKVWAADGGGGSPGTELGSGTIDEVILVQQSIVIAQQGNQLLRQVQVVLDVPVTYAMDLFVGIQYASTTTLNGANFNYGVILNENTRAFPPPFNRSWFNIGTNPRTIPLGWNTWTTIQPQIDAGLSNIMDILIRPVVELSTTDLEQNDIWLRSRLPGGEWVEHGNLMGKCPYTSLTWCMLPGDDLEIEYKDLNDNDNIKTEVVTLIEYDPIKDVPLTDIASHKDSHVNQVARITGMIKEPSTKITPHTTNGSAFV